MKALDAYLSDRRGAKAELARILGLTRAAVCLWKRVPAEHVIAVERHTGIPRTQLRPDLYPANEAA
jgi:DNA-binding transcriptional regulator YdaS (Cro superfamily)